jgi:hypothetical protein
MGPEIPALAPGLRVMVAPGAMVSKWLHQPLFYTFCSNFILMFFVILILCFTQKSLLHF